MRDIYPATDDYAHAIEVRDPARFLFVAGTMGLDTDGTPGASRRSAAGGSPTTAIVAQTLTEDWLVEIEIVAAA
ncbi:MAG: hypothetical protein M3422_07555 [Actinomycetota bacterium]|nr:hypothetical protein [Actinomycetota bacterium]